MAEPGSESAVEFASVYDAARSMEGDLSRMASSLADIGYGAEAAAVRNVMIVIRQVADSDLEQRVDRAISAGGDVG